MDFNKFKDLTYVPENIQKQNSILDLLLRLSQEIVELREKKAEASEKSGIAKQTLLQYESQLGATIFVSNSQTRQARSFFCMDKDTWIWYEMEFDSLLRKSVSKTVRYEITKDGVFKVAEKNEYQEKKGELI